MIHKLFVVSVFTFLSLSVGAIGNGKKVYADFHGVRYTRQHDGQVGRWGMFAEMPKTNTAIKYICHNADNICDDGRHDIAAVHYPLVGMQSNLDEDYIEYQILSAKIAGIDGFFIEWGFYPHENNHLLKAMQAVAAKYDFEIGVNWCDGWLFYNWITRVNPKIKTREDKAKYMETCFGYLVDSVFSVKTAPIVKGHPVFYHFGPGATTEEFKQVLRKNQNFVNERHPVILRRWADWGTLDKGVYQPICYSKDIEEWKKLGEIPTPWIPARVRGRDAAHPNCDFWASQDDVLRFLQPFRDSVWLSSNPSYTVKSGFVMPGMDNHGCGGWGHSKFYEIDRNQGKLYDAMWQYNMQYRDSLDMIFIASWSDYTEGHEIEPTYENGYRELETTLRYSSLFKEFEPSPQALRLPYQLFQLRKAVELLQSIGLNEHSLKKMLDDAALKLSSAQYSGAEQLMTKASALLEQENAKVENNEFTLGATDLKIQGGTKSKDAWDATEGFSVTLPIQALVNLNNMYSRGFLEFWYLDKGLETLFVRSSTLRQPKLLFTTVGKLATCATGKWKHARIELFGENISYAYGKPTLYFKGNVSVRDLSIKYNCFSILQK